MDTTPACTFDELQLSRRPNEETPIPQRPGRFTIDVQPLYGDILMDGFGAPPAYCANAYDIPDFFVLRYRSSPVAPIYVLHHLVHQVFSPEVVTNYDEFFSGSGYDQSFFDNDGSGGAAGGGFSDSAGPASDTGSAAGGDLTGSDLGAYFSYGNGEVGGGQFALSLLIRLRMYLEHQYLAGLPISSRTVPQVVEVARIALLNSDYADLIVPLDHFAQVWEVFREYRDVQPHTAAEEIDVDETDESSATAQEQEQEAGSTAISASAASAAPAGSVHFVCKTVCANYVVPPEYQRLMTTLHSAVQPTVRSPTRIAVLTGAMGIGKTELAAYYISQQARHHSTVCWFAQCDDRVAIGQQIDSVLAAAGKRLLPVPCLLVFDNVAEFAQVKDFVPAKGAHVIITTRNAKPGVWPSTAFTEVLPVDALPLEQGIELFGNLNSHCVQQKVICGELSQRLRNPLLMCATAARLTSDNISRIARTLNQSSIVASLPIDKDQIVLKRVQTMLQAGLANSALLKEVSTLLDLCAACDETADIPLPFITRYLCYDDVTQRYLCDQDSACASACEQRTQDVVNEACRWSLVVRSEAGILLPSIIRDTWPFRLAEPQIRNAAMALEMYRKQHAAEHLALVQRGLRALLSVMRAVSDSTDADAVSLKQQLVRHWLTLSGRGTNDRDWSTPRVIPADIQAFIQTRELVRDDDPELPASAVRVPRTPAACDILDELMHSPSGVLVLYGNAGSGKSTIVAELVQIARSSMRFDRVMYSQSSGLPNDKRLRDIDDLNEATEDKLALGAHWDLRMKRCFGILCQSDNGLETACQNLAKQDCLLIFDNVTTFFGLRLVSRLAGHLKQHGRRSAIIVVTRFEALARPHPTFRLLPIPCLSDDEAMQLVRNHAFPTTDEEHNALKNVVSLHSRKLPLFLETAGRALQTRSHSFVDVANMLGAAWMDFQYEPETGSQMLDSAFDGLAHLASPGARELYIRLGILSMGSRTPRKLLQYLCMLQGNGLECIASTKQAADALIDELVARGYLRLSSPARLMRQSFMDRQDEHSGDHPGIGIPMLLWMINMSKHDVLTQLADPAVMHALGPLMPAVTATANALSDDSNPHYFMHDLHWRLARRQLDECPNATVGDGTLTMRRLLNRMLVEAVHAEGAYRNDLVLEVAFKMHCALHRGALRTLVDVKGTGDVMFLECWASRGVEGLASKQNMIMAVLALTRRQEHAVNALHLLLSRTADRERALVRSSITSHNALHFAAARGFAAICDLLVQAVPMLKECKDHKGKRPMDLARRNGHVACAEICAVFVHA
eukprot:TRINITY_DN2027_c0_g1_i1.p1 TRINITY_DN2027_c0_g1~~TRINITY_DN2027_c0_g1_i1.p1  ORF type:complete len:1514 (+),score=368.20 TRINITY_DN2027_c0_g1_i1:639-4544(+)